MKRQEAYTKKRLEETRSKRQDKALLQHPIINQSSCIGCGICVEVCPEGDVLGLIDGKATIIHGSHKYNVRIKWMNCYLANMPSVFQP
ncbi:MAG: 4Fe-4S binding protein [Candidatus Marinimicrobia bacterium]|jgi:NAD-dependent dihydropyrimidine dehydrogenase PreA subunit|nr:4Fe-4S binding protein [Candidatus Neomarinimicrobiota bacterium]MBT5995217.1 4Fe-4S binding protein [Candidatus Neomarinimicrobiota bacterium]